jgi:hypothetical protein
MRLRTRLGCISASALVSFALSVNAQDEAAIDAQGKYWQVVRREMMQDLFVEPARSSQDLCRTIAAKNVPLDWDGGAFPESVWHLDYFAQSLDDCAELDVNSYKFLAEAIEEQTLVRLLQNLESMVTGLSGESLAAFERFFGRGADPAARLTYDTLVGVGVSDFDPRFVSASRYELYFQGPGMYFIVQAESEGAGFRAVSVTIQFDSAP